MLLHFYRRRFLLFTAIIVLKGALAWYVVFDDGPSLTMLLTEVPFFWATFSLIEWFVHKRKILFYTMADMLFTLLFFAVVMYYKYYGVIVTYHALSQAAKITRVGNSTYSLMDPYYLLIFIDIIVFASLPLWWRRKQAGMLIQLKRTRKPYLTLLLVISVALCFLSIWPNRASMNESKKAQEMGILNYELYTIFADVTEDDDMIEMKHITQDAINALKGVGQSRNTRYFGAGKGKNIIAIQLETFQNFLIGLTIDGQEITPNMNRLADQNIHFDHFYSMVGQGTTSDAEYVVNTSLYIPKNDTATAHVKDKALPSLPKLLHANGYITATFHTNRVGFWNRKELYSSLGWDQYYDQSFFGDEDYLAFGASDEVLYAKTRTKLEEMSRSIRPFYAQIISMSAHHPFQLPESKYKMKLPDSLQGTLVGDYFRAQNYADYALGTFVGELKRTGLWDKSIILLYGDHQGLPVYALHEKERRLMKQILGREYDYTEMFKMPFILRAPGVPRPSLQRQTGGFIDILPTVANLAGVSLNDQIHFGQDLHNQRSNLLPMRHFLPSGSFVEDHCLFLPGITYHDGENYLLSPTNMLEDRATEDQYRRALQLLHLSDSYVKQLPNKNKQ